MIPPKFRNNLSILPQYQGNKERELLNEGITNDQPDLPRGVMIDDLDTSFIEFVKKDLEISIDGEKVPVVFLTLQRFNEFSKTWQFTGEHKDISMPFITIVRKPDIQPGTQQNKLFNTADKKMYTYLRVPTWNGTRKGIDKYQIPQPTAVDLNYEVRFFSNKMRDTNDFQTKLQKTFNSRQFYVFPNGHAMPVVLETVGDESNISDFESRRFYLQLFDLKLLGYILDENDFIITPEIDRMLITTEIRASKRTPIIKVKTEKDTSLVNWDLIFQRFSESTFTTTLQFDTRFLVLDNIINLSSVEILVNNVVVTVPFIANAGDQITFNIVKINNYESRFNLSGNLI